MANKKTTKIQTLIFNRNNYSNKSKIKKWIRDNGFKLPKKKDPIKKYDKKYRVRQRDPSRFKKTTFRTINIKKGVKAVIGFLK